MRKRPAWKQSPEISGDKQPVIARSKEEVAGANLWIPSSPVRGKSRQHTGTGTHGRARRSRPSACLQCASGGAGRSTASLRRSAERRAPLPRPGCAQRDTASRRPACRRSAHRSRSARSRSRRSTSSCTARAEVRSARGDASGDRQTLGPKPYLAYAQLPYTSSRALHYNYSGSRCRLELRRESHTTVQRIQDADPVRRDMRSPLPAECEHQPAGDYERAAEERGRAQPL